MLLLMLEGICGRHRSRTITEHRLRQEEAVLLVVRLLQLHESLVEGALGVKMVLRFCQEASCITAIRHKTPKKTFFYGNSIILLAAGARYYV
jgi:uncharacterized membrane protein YsdA (DUF1294 family)